MNIYPPRVMTLGAKLQCSIRRAIQESAPGVERDRLAQAATEFELALLDLAMGDIEE